MQLFFDLLFTYSFTFALLYTYMANIDSKKQSRQSGKNNLETVDKTDRTRKVKLAFGITFLLIGVFISFSTISYFFTWQTDQDKLLSSKSAWDFLRNNDSIITNWGGRMGALLSHTLVYRTAGVVGLAVGLWISIWGLHLVYGQKTSKIAKYLRWLCLLLLLAAPALAYTLPNATFPWGGAWGNESIEFLNGLIGRMGTGFGLFGLVCFLAFVIFSLDISPMLNRAKNKAGQISERVTDAIINKEEEEEEEETATKTIPSKLTDNSAEKKMINGRSPIDDYKVPQINEALTKLEIVEKAAPIVATNQHIPESYIASNTIVEEEDGHVFNFAIPEKEEIKNNLNNDPEFSFEIIQQEEKIAPAIVHGAHISIQDNEPYAPELDLPDYKFPTLDLLEDRIPESISLNKEELEKNKNQIIQTLRSFGIEIQRISATVGPTVTLYEIVPAEGVRISKIRNLEDDIALNLAALGIRIIAPIPGRGTIGIEVPNANKQIVSMRALLSSEKFVNNKMSLPIALGKKIDNENYIVDLATMPHLLMAGATGQGKSVGINAVLVSLLYKKHPSQLKFVLIDPKKVELSIYKVIEKHFLAKLPNEEESIITDTKKVINTLNALCIEMDNRYELLKEAGTRNIKEYNEKFISRRLNPEKGHKYLPFIVLVVDEFADLIMTAGKEVEMPIARLAQLARAIGIHLIVATQRPSVNVITGTIKANFPARIAFKVSAKVDSRTILDSGGAEQLVGRGDMLISHGSELLRLQCAFVDTPEVEKIVEFIGAQRGYASAFELPEYEGEEGGASGKVLDIGNRDELFEECARLIVQSQSGSTSNLQRRLNLGYNRAGRIMDQIEAAGIVGPAVGSKPREVYVKTEAELEAYI